jgi:AraC-like DNA-binding protein
MVQPLDSYPLVRTSDLDQLRTVLAALFQDSVFAMGSDRQSVGSCINFYPLTHTRLMYGNFGAAIRASFGEMQFFVHGITLRGSGEQLTNGKATSANVGGLLSPRTKLGLHFAPGFETLAMIIEADVLARKLDALVGTRLREPIAFEVNQEFDHPAALKLRLLIGSLANSLTGGAAEAPLIALVEMEQAILTCFLLGNRHNHSSLLEHRPPSAAPWQVKWAEEYIEANWDQPLTIESLADVTGASARSVFHAFKQARGCSPMAFLRQVRLQRAWLMLNASDARATVTDVAYTCGFGNLGHFAGHFRAKFGETPSDVLFRSKGRP